MTVTTLVHRAVEPQPIAACGIIGVDVRPVTVVGDENGFNPRALEFAVEFAQGRQLALRVVQVWPEQRDGVVTAAWLATRQAELDASIADLQARHPGLPIAAWIELMAGWVAFVREHSSLVVVAGGALAGAVCARAASDDSCPVAVAF